MQRELELIERDCEQLRRENALLQSWLHREKVSDIDSLLNDINHETHVEYKQILT